MTFNTYGFFSINQKTFNRTYGGHLSYPHLSRNVVVTALRIHNGALNVMGYLSEISFFSGCVRVLTGLSIVLITLAIGDRNSERGAIVGHWYDEALATGIAQIARGVLEASRFGWHVNAVLDVIGTVINAKNLVEELFMHSSSMDEDLNRIVPYKDINYVLPLKILYLV